jgi:hypothetical protein
MIVEIGISLSASIAAGTPGGLWAEMGSLLPAGWIPRKGSNAIDFIVDYPWSEQSHTELAACCSTFSYGFLSLVEGRGTASCRLVSLMEPLVGFVITFNGAGHPRPGAAFSSHVRFVD